MDLTKRLCTANATAAIDTSFVRYFEGCGFTDTVVHRQVSVGIRPTAVLAYQSRVLSAGVTIAKLHDPGLSPDDPWLVMVYML